VTVSVRFADCDWCKDLDTENADRLCDSHRAEFLGYSVAEMHRGEAIRSAEWMDAQS